MDFYSFILKNGLKVLIAVKDALGFKVLIFPFNLLYNDLKCLLRLIPGDVTLSCGLDD